MINNLYLKEDISIKQKMLGKIRYSVSQQSSSGCFYKRALSIHWGVVGFSLSLLFFNEIIGLKFDNLILVSIFTGCFISVLFYYLTNYPKTWVEHIDNLLTEYDPVDNEAYNQLQLITKNKGFLDIEDVLGWVKDEEKKLISVNKIIFTKDKPLNFIKTIL